MQNGSVGDIPSDDKARKRAAMAAAKEARAAARKAEAEALADEADELEEKYESSGKRRGVDFDVHTTLVGNFVVRNPDFVVAKKFADVPSDKKSVEDVIHFVAPCVLFPEPMTARAAFQEHAGIAWDLALKIMRLHSADASSRTGK